MTFQGAACKHQFRDENYTCDVFYYRQIGFSLSPPLSLSPSLSQQQQKEHPAQANQLVVSNHPQHPSPSQKRKADSK